MKHKMFAAGMTLIVACSLAAYGWAADEGKPADVKKMPVHSAKCTSPCSFSVKGQNREEVAAILKEHAKTQHQKELTDQDLESMVKSPKKK